MVNITINLVSTGLGVLRGEVEGPNNLQTRLVLISQSKTLFVKTLPFLAPALALGGIMEGLKQDNRL